jgi:hypothetical protein
MSLLQIYLSGIINCDTFSVAPSTINDIVKSGVPLLLYCNKLMIATSLSPSLIFVGKAVTGLHSDGWILAHRH